MRIKYARKRLFFVIKKVHRPVTRGETYPRKIFASPGKMCWAYFETIGRSSKNVSPSQKTFRPPRCPKLVTGLEVQQTFSFPFSLLRHYQMPECFYVNNCCF